MSDQRHLSRYSQQFASQLDELGWRTYDRIVSFVDNLERNPHLGRRYEPLYESSPPPTSCRYLYVPGTMIACKMGQAAK